MLSLLRTSAVLLLGFMLLTGITYPVLVTGVAQATFPYQANGSIIQRNGERYGSALIGQPFDTPHYFWTRPSATAGVPYNGALSGASNLGPTNPALRTAVAERVAALQATHAAPAPVDLVTASASGLDPHISPAAAHYQAARVAAARGLDIAAVHQLVQRATEPRALGVIGEPVVNVLLLNLQLDQLASTPRPPQD